VNSNLLPHLQKYSLLYGIGVSFIAGFLFALTPYWQLAFVAGFLGGFVNSTQKRGTISGLIGMVLAWAFSIGYYSILNNTYILFDQLGAFILNRNGMGWTLIMIILLIGAAIGALGGIIGAGIHILVIKPIKKEEIIVSHE